MTSHANRPASSPRRMSAAWLPILIIAVGPTAFAEEAPPVAIEITGCAVWSELRGGIRHDCMDEARTICEGKGFCELPIGLNLTAGRDLDNDPDTWELVRVDYRCGAKALINGPHHQNDHATMTLACGPH